MRHNYLAAACLAACMPLAAHAAGNLRIGLAEDIDTLDPGQSGFYVGRIVFAAMCDKLVDLDPQLNFKPQLATAWAWSPDNLTLTLTLRDGVKFQDGEPMDAEAVRANIERYRSAPESVRKGEVKPIASIEVADPHTVRLHLSQPYAPLVAVLADRAGMMLSPKTLALGKDIGNAPVCAGPFKFTSRVPQQNIILDRFPGYWDAGAISLDRITYAPVPDTTVRRVNLQAGQFDLIERMAPTDVAAVKADPKLRVLTSPSIAFFSLFINTAHGPQADNPLGRDKRVREAFEKSLDRSVINQVVYDGQFVPNNQTQPPGSLYWDSAHPVPPRDIPGARALLKAAGQEKVTITLQVQAAPVAQQLGEIIQSMAAEAGFDVKLQALEANAANAAELSGEYQIATGIWSGRPDPDGNLAIWLASDGFLNWGKYSNKAIDDLLVQARSVTDVPARQALYRKIVDIYTADRPFITLYHQRWLFGLSDRLTGFSAVPDGLIRPQGMVLKN